MNKKCRNSGDKFIVVYIVYTGTLPIHPLRFVLLLDMCH